MSDSVPTAAAADVRDWDRLPCGRPLPAVEREMGSALPLQTLSLLGLHLLVRCPLLHVDNRRYRRQRARDVDTRDMPGRPERRIRQEIVRPIHYESISRMKVVQVCTGEPISTRWP